MWDCHPYCVYTVIGGSLCFCCHPEGVYTGIWGSLCFCCHPEGVYTGIWGSLCPCCHPEGVYTGIWGSLCFCCHPEGVYTSVWGSLCPCCHPERPGVCPSLEEMDLEEYDCVSECHTDTDCDEGLKCCIHICGSVCHPSQGKPYLLVTTGGGGKVIVCNSGSGRGIRKSC